MIRKAIHNIFTYIEKLQDEVRTQDDRYHEWLEGRFTKRKPSRYQQNRDQYLQRKVSQYEGIKVGFLLDFV